jgi:hypothetical protein
MNKEVTDKKEDLFKVGIAGYPFVKFKLEPSLEMMERVNVVSKWKVQIHCR